MKRTDDLERFKRTGEQIERRIEKREALSRAPATRDEVRERIVSEVAARGAAYKPRGGSLCGPTFESPRSLLDLSDGLDVERAFCAFVPEAVIAVRMQQEEAHLAQQPEGISAADREARLRTLDAEIERLCIDEEARARRLEGDGYEVDRRAAAPPHIVLRRDLDVTPDRQAA